MHVPFVDEKCGNPTAECAAERESWSRSTALFRIRATADGFPRGPLTLFSSAVKVIENPFVEGPVPVPEYAMRFPTHTARSGYGA